MAVTFKKAATIETIAEKVQNLPTYVLALVDEVATVRRLLERDPSDNGGDF